MNTWMTLNVDEVTGRLYPFQREDVEALVDRKAVLIGNEMGTGKTYEAIALDVQRRHWWYTGSDLGPDLVHTAAQRARAHTLVVCPLTVVPSWANHYRDLAPSLEVVTLDPRNRGEFLQRLKARDADVYILHWDVLRIIKEELQAIPWLHIIADEVHRAKNRKTQQTRALKSIKATFKTGLSGTPVMNQPQDLWSILNWLYPSQWSSYWKFYERYVEYELQYPQQYRKVIGPKNEDELKERMTGFFKRRLKTEVLTELPEKYYSKIYVDLDPKQRRAYEQMKKEMIAWLENHEGEITPLIAPAVIAQLTRLQQLAAAYVDIVPSTKDDSTSAILTEPSSKLDALFELMEDNPDEPFVIFSRFKQLIRLVERRMEKAGLSYSIVTGDITGTDRGNQVDAFQAGKTDHFLGTIGAGSEGITLTRASTVIFLDRDWTPARNAQAEDRCHRIGQVNAVEVIDIIAKDTVDLGHMQKLEMKKEWIRRLLD